MQDLHNGMGGHMKPIDRVRLITDKYASKGIISGDIGYVHEDYGDGCFEVEFSDPNGTTIALFAFRKEDLELVD